MTIWRPLTCPCELEIDGNKWIKTIKKCSLHKEYTGQKLLNEVSKHNKENGPPEDPGFMTFFVGLDFDPDWMKSVAKFPSLEKINESKFNLESMSKYNPTDKEFQYTLSNFLNSSRSILWFLLEEYNRKFGFDIGKYFTDKKYREKRKESLSLEAEKFLDWYEKKFEDLKKEKSSFLIDKRDINIHSGYVKQIFKPKQGPYRVHEDQIKNGYDIPIDLKKVMPFFPEDKDSTVIELCKVYIKNIENLVYDCHNQFPFN
jgi:hypothetical protein